MLLQFGDEYKLVLRLVVVALIVPGDTSECERIFSLMNNIKTVDRARMGQRNLKNLMLWHEMGKELEPEQYIGWPSWPQSSPPCESYHL